MAFSSPCWRNMWFFYSSSNTRHTIVRCLGSSKGCPLPSTQLLWDEHVEEYHFCVGPPFGSWNATRLSSTWSSRSSISLPRLNKYLFGVRPFQSTWEPRFSWTHFQIILSIRTTIYKHNISHAAKHVRMCYIQWLSCWPSPVVEKHRPKLLPLNASFTNQRRCGTKNSSKVHVTHQARGGGSLPLKFMHTRALMTYLSGGGLFPLQKKL